MIKRQIQDFPVAEREQMAEICKRVGLAPGDFEVTDETRDAGAGSDASMATRKVSVKRAGTEAQSVYEDDPPGTWLEQFESDLECGLFGPLSA